MSGNMASVVEVPELSAESLSDELPVLDEPSLVELEPPELDSSGRVVTPGVVKLVEVAPGPLQATRRAARERRTGPTASKCSAKPLRSQARAWPLPWSVDEVIDVCDQAAVFL
jgi:hypothetical protein